MNQPTQMDAATRWQKLLETEQAYLRARSDFLADANDRVAILRQALRGPHRETVLGLLDRLTEQERQHLFPEWVHLARCAHSPFQHAWSVLLELPRDWVLDHIEAEVDAILQSEEEDDYWMFLQLYEQLDQNLALKLARRAAAHPNPDIQALGEEYHERLAGSAVNGIAKP